MARAKKHTGTGPGLYRWSISGRGWDLDGLSVVTRAQFVRGISRTVHLGEVAGKHSDVSYTLDRKDFTLLTCDAEFISRMQSIGVLDGGINPFAYGNTCDRCGEEQGLLVPDSDLCSYCVDDTD